MRTQVRRPGIPDFPYTPLAAAVALALASPAAFANAPCALASICVTDPGDSNPLGGGVFNVYGGQIDLRGALNNCAANNVIAFDTSDVRYNPSGGPFVIAISDDLPVISCDNLVIDGAGSHTDSVSRVTIDGSSANATRYPYGLDYGLNAFPTYGGAVTVRGLAVRNIANGPGLQGTIIATENIVSGSTTGIFTSQTISSNRVFGNVIGIQPSSSNQQVLDNVVFNNTTGVSASNFFGTLSGNVIGLDNAGRARGNTTGVALGFSAASLDENVISNNGVGVSLSLDEGTVLDSNWIGTDQSGTGLKANQVGVLLNFSYGTSIFGNTIAAPLTGTAIQIEQGSQGITISGNNINTDVDGTGLLGGGEGVIASCSFDIQVDSNLITTSGRNAIDFAGVSHSSRPDITGNAIGVKFASSTAIGSVLNGIYLHDANCSAGAAVKAATASTPAAPKWLGSATMTNGIQVQGNVIFGATQNGIGLDGASNTSITGNTVTGSALYGVEIEFGTGNAIVDNTIRGNAVTLAGTAAKNIDLGFHGAPLPNDAGDTDAAPVPNNGQNYPQDITVRYDPQSDLTTVSFALDSQPGIYRIDIYGNSPATTVPGGTPLANTFLTISAGKTFGSYSLGGRHDSLSLTATATNAGSVLIETSEFSPVNNSTLVPAVQVSPTTVNFGNIGVNSDSPSQRVTVRSSGTDTYVIGAIGDTTCYGGTICYGGAFTCSTTCAQGSGYNPGQTCQFTATFHPTAITSYSQTIAICDNAAGGAYPGRLITLRGNGVIPPPVSFDPSDFDFGTIAVGHQSPPERFTVSNPGSSTVTLGAFSTTIDFLLGGNTCTTPLGPGGTCTVDVSFVPGGPGRVTGMLSVQAGGTVALSSTKVGKIAIDTGPPSGATANASLTGTGTIQAILDIPSLVDFGTYPLGAAPITRVVALHNAGNAPLHFTTVSVNGPFGMVNGCPATLDADQTCNITLTFSAGDVGSFTGGLVIASDAAGGSGSVLLTAQAVATAEPKLLVTPETIGFGSRMIGTTQGTQRVTIKNIGASDAAMSTTTIDGPDFFVASTTCGPVLSPSSTCFAEVGFRPAGFGSRKARLSVNSNAVNNPQVVNLAGTGCRPFSISSGGASSCSP